MSPVSVIVLRMSTPTAFREAGEQIPGSRSLSGTRTAQDVNLLNSSLDRLPEPVIDDP
jgi:hypothetical protein